MAGCLTAPTASAAPGKASACAGAGLRPSPSDGAAVATATLCLINLVRSAHHARPLRFNRALGAVAAGQLSSMVHSNYFADVRPTGQTPMSLVAASGYRNRTTGFAVGQNLAWGTGAYSTPAHIVAEWMASPPHRAIMLSGEYRDAGLAVTATVPSVLNPDHDGATYAIEFGVRWF